MHTPINICNIQQLIYFHVYNLHSKNLHHMTRRDFLYTKHICCTYHVWAHSKWYILHHESIFLCHTHMLHMSCMSVHGLYTLTFYDVSTLRHMSTLYTHMLHISSDIETTPVPTWNRRPAPASRGYAAHWQCNWVTHSHKSNLLRILHKKLRCQQINSQFGSGLIKRLYEFI